MGYFEMEVSNLSDSLRYNSMVWAIAGGPIHGMGYFEVKLNIARDMAYMMRYETFARITLFLSHSNTLTLHIRKTCVPHTNNLCLPVIKLRPADLFLLSCHPRLLGATLKGCIMLYRLLFFLEEFIAPLYYRYL